METRRRSRWRPEIWLPLAAAAVVFMISSLVVYAAYNEHQAKLNKLAALERERLERNEKATDAVYFAVAEGTRAAGALHASAWCVASTYVAFGPFGALLSGMLCSALMYQATDGASEAVHAELFDRPYHQDAAALGRVVGMIGGALLMAPPADYGTYEVEARALTEQTYRANRALIDPEGLRGANHHLHHIVPLRCGFALGIPAAIMASRSNLEVITAEANQRIGAMGCSG